MPFYTLLLLYVLQLFLERYYNSNSIVVVLHITLNILLHNKTTIHRQSVTALTSTYNNVFAVLRRRTW